MSYREALKFFDLDDLYSEKELKTKYYSFVKLYHPDQNKDINPDKMKKINAMYNILENELKKRKARDIKDKLLNNINKLKDKYKETKIYDFCILYENKLSNLNNIIDINTLKNEFDSTITKLKEETVLPNEKRKSLKNINKYLKGYSLDIKKLASEYSILITNAISLEKLNTIKQKFDILIKEELIKEKQRVIDYKNKKDSFKRALAYRFLEYAKLNNINNIIIAHDLLMISYSILNITTIENIEEVSVILDKLRFDNLEDNINKLKKYYFKLINVNYEVDNQKINISKSKKENNDLIDKTLDKYYLYITNKTTKLDKVLEQEKLFKETITLINDLDEKHQEIINNFIENEKFNNIKMIIESINDFSDFKKIYIERKTGNICILKQRNKKIYTIYLNGDVKSDLINIKDIYWKYISLSKFFLIAKYSKGKEVDEVNLNDRAMLGDYDTNFLYFTSELLLFYSEKDNREEFKFIPAMDGYYFTTRESDQITRNDYFKKYSNKDICLNDLMNYIKNQINIEKNEKKL